MKITPVEANLGFNNGNGAPANALRPGVADGASWTIDRFDDRTEDQGNGFSFWFSDDKPATGDNIEDMAPFVIEVPQQLIDDGWRFALQMTGGSGGYVEASTLSTRPT